MAFLQIKSENPDFSFLIKKNPSSAMLIKPLRKGTVFGYYSKNNHQEFNIFFRDNSDQASFDDEFSYLNTSQFSSGEFVLNAISLFLSHNLKNLDEKDSLGLKNSIIVNCLEVKSIDFINFLKKYFPNVDIEFQEINSKNINLTISSKDSLHKLINTLALIIVFNLFNRFEYIETSLLEKYVNCIKVIDAPYFIRYLFKRFLPSKKFKELKNILEYSENQKLNLTLGNNVDSRKRFVSQNISCQNPIVDLGCGEGSYLFLSNKSPWYYGIDVDELELEKAKNKALKKNLENTSFLKSLNELKINKNFDLLFIEVMEHMPLDKAIDLLQQIKNIDMVNSILITTPNKDFNSNYALEGFRHDDHDFEMTAREFEVFCKNNFSDLNYEIFQIGDLVDGIAPTQGVKVWK